MNKTHCPGCGLALKPVEGPVHRYMTSSPACWEVYGEVLTREYSDPAYGKYHRLTVDAYAVQHPGSKNNKSIQSIAVHLVSLYGVIERGLSAREATALIKRACDMHSGLDFQWLEPPKDLGDLKVVSVLPASSAEEHGAAVNAWAQSAWEAWSPHHHVIRRWAHIAAA